MSGSWRDLLLFALTGLLGGISDLLIKLSVVRSQPLWLVLGCVSYVLTALAVSRLLHLQVFAVAMGLFLAFNIIFALLLGSLVFHEPLTTRQGLGIALALVVVYLTQFQ